MNGLILTQNLNGASLIQDEDYENFVDQDLNNADDDQWWIDHDAYADALEEYRKVETELQKALGVVKDFEKTSWTASEAIEDLNLNSKIYGLIHCFEEAVINRFKAKAKL